MRFLRTPLIIALGLVTLLGCGESEVEDISDSPEADEVQEEVSELEGVWASRCQSGAFLGLSELVELEFRGDEFIERHRIYKDQNCQQLAVVIDYEGLADMDVAEDIYFEQAKGINFDYGDVRVTPISADGVELLESTSFCGVSGWQRNGTLNLSRESGDNGCSLKDVPTTRYDIYWVNRGVLYLGVPLTVEGPRVADHRPQTIYREGALVRL